MLYSVLLAAPQGQAGSPLPTFIMMGGIMVVFYFFMIRPQAKKAKEQKKFIDNLQKGDKIVTIAGIHGTINKVNDDNTLQLEVSPGSYIKIEKSALSQEWTTAMQKANAGTIAAADSK
ncbi:preprotein translocase subunit YajC [Filimonas zeae]|uniref:Sec translocon accessory complex subunit YajC n=1 Tax=Filimonas zeae TaxID=1737353 RepID=A0A917IWK2_9BACT|nr:preprotein translocase subunit YajC [Filimonas zeae]MDR6339038.1 preprotein translocase subunit YajC [Filimonas zeae]GGH65400.1 preprotein translocase subunit YajC [Filimonas zeae]